MSRVPPTPGPLPPGGVVLGSVPSQQMVRRTDRTTDFHGCSVGFYVMLNEENICTGYRIQIQDPMDNHTYNLDFGQEILDEWKKNIQQFPNVGEKPNAVN